MEKIIVGGIAPRYEMALTKNDILHNYHILIDQDQQKKSNIYFGKISQIQNSVEALFIDCGGKKNGFLPAKEINPVYFKNHETYQEDKNLLNQFDEGQMIMVQVSRERRNKKGVMLTSYIALSGYHSILIFFPKPDYRFGISKKIQFEERARLKQVAENDIDLPENLGLIFRTSALNSTIENIQADIDFLIKIHKQILSAPQQKEPYLIYRENDPVASILKAYGQYHASVEKIYIEDSTLYARVKQQAKETFSNEDLDELEVYDQLQPIMDFFKLQKTIDTIFAQEVILKSGGSIVIDNTEALTSIDINSSKATKHRSLSETAFNTNMEAAETITQQIRWRDLGGLIVIDLIDMKTQEHQKIVLKQFEDLMSDIRACVRFSNISKFGLLEISKQYIGSNVRETTMKACPHCHATGSIKHADFFIQEILNEIRKFCFLHTNVRNIQCTTTYDIAIRILNTYAHEIHKIREKFGGEIFICPDPFMHSRQYTIDPIKKISVHTDNFINTIQKNKSSKIIQEKLDEKAYIDTSYTHLTAQQKKKKFLGIFPLR